MTNYIFEGIHDSFELATQACENCNVSKSFPIEIWKKRQLGYLNQAKVSAPRHECISSILKSHNIRQVMDFGGGSGWLFKHLSRQGFQLDSRNILETEESIEIFSPFSKDIDWITSRSLKFLKVIKNESIFYSNSCIQYIPELDELLKVIQSQPWGFLILEDIPNVTKSDFWTRQNYHGFSVPYRFFDLENLIGLISKYDFRLIARNDYFETYPEGWNYKIKTEEGDLSPNTPQSLIFGR